MRLLIAIVLVASSAHAAADDCTGLVPELPGGGTVATVGDDSRSGESCFRPGTIDGRGAILVFHSSSTGEGIVLAQGGAVVARFPSGALDLQAVYPQSDGFLLATQKIVGTDYVATLSGVSHDGAMRGSTSWTVGHAPPGSFTLGPENVAFLPGPDGGVIALRAESSSPDAEAAWRITAQRIDASGAGPAPALLGAGPGPIPNVSGAVVNDGSLLLLVPGFFLDGFRDNQMVGRWFAPGLTPSTEFFVAVSQSIGPFSATSLADGSAAVRASDWWRGRTEPGSQSVVLPPAWLPSYPPALFMLPGKRGAAVVLERPIVDPGDCEQHIEVRAPAGNLCGILRVPMEKRADGFCLAGPLSVGIGADGTLIENPGVAGNRCSFRFWPRLFANP